MQTDTSMPTKKPKLFEQTTLSHSELVQLSSDLYCSYREKQQAFAPQKESILLRIASTISVDTVENEVMDLFPLKRLREDEELAQESDCFSAESEDEHTFSSEFTPEVEEIPQNVLLLNNTGEQFYSMQVISDLRGKGEYHLWTRWGKCGMRGRRALIGPFLTVQRLRNELQTRRAEKEKDGYTDAKRKSGWSGPVHTRSSDHKVESLSRLLTSDQLAQSTLRDLGYGDRFRPFSELTEDDISSAFHTLKSLEKAITDNDFNAIPRLTQEFYELIPHKQPYDTDGDTQIDHVGKLRTQTALLTTLSSLKQRSSERDISNRLCRVEKESELFARLKGCFESTESRALMYQTEIVDAFEVRDESAMAEDESVGLWYGARTSAWGHILHSGVPTYDECPASTFPHLPGATLYDCSSRATANCYPTHKQTSGLVGLCQVSLGHCVEAAAPLSQSSPISESYDSVKIIGRMAAGGPEMDVAGLKVASGPMCARPACDSRVIFNELIVRDSARIRVKYLLHLRFLFP